MELQSVNSSMIRAVGYNSETKEMEVVFTSGKIFVYSNVPEKIFDGLLTAKSKGQYMRAHVIAAYPYQVQVSKRRR
jgi:hypothetical protein